MCEREERRDLHFMPPSDAANRKRELGYHRARICVKKSTERGVLSVARFCYVFPCELRRTAWAVGSYSISQSAEGTSQNIIFKTLRQIGRPTLYKLKYISVPIYQTKEMLIKLCQIIQFNCEPGCSRLGRSPDFDSTPGRFYLQTDLGHITNFGPGRN